eukprot:Em1090g1a
MAATTRQRRSNQGHGSLRQSLGPPSRNPVDEPIKSAVASFGRAGSLSSIPAALQTQASRKSTYQPYGNRASSAGMGAGRKGIGCSEVCIVGYTTRYDRSSIYGQGGSQVKKDPRPLADKSYQTASIKKLILFLAEHGYSQAVTYKSLQLPSAKEFTNIFNFLLSLIDKGLCIPEGAKIAEEVPKILKLLGYLFTISHNHLINLVLSYPFTISHNHLINLGSPHAWPIVLGSVTWLTEQEFELESYAYQQFMLYGPDSEEYTEVTRKREERFSEFGEMDAHVNLTRSESLASFIETDLVPSIRQLELEAAEVEETGSHLEVQIDATIEKVKQLRSLCVHSDKCQRGAARLVPPNYEISNRSDPEAMLQLMKHSRELKLHSEKVRKQLEMDNIQHRLDIEKETLEKKKREREEVMKNEQLQKHNVERQVLLLQQGLAEIGTAEKQLAKVNAEVETATGVLAAQMRQSCEGIQQHMAALLKYIQVAKASIKGRVWGGAPNDRSSLRRISGSSTSLN